MNFKRNLWRPEKNGESSFRAETSKQNSAHKRLPKIPRSSTSSNKKPQVTPPLNLKDHHPFPFGPYSSSNAQIQSFRQKEEAPMNRNVAFSKEFEEEKHNAESQGQKVGQNGKVKGFGCFSTTGLVRKTNEDRFVAKSHIYFENPAIFLENHGESSPRTHSPQKPFSIFCVFDGHAGSGCSSFLKVQVCSEFSDLVGFFEHPESSLRELCEKLEEKFLTQALESKQGRKSNDRSGSCATICIILGISHFRTETHKVHLSRKQRVKFGSRILETAEQF